MDRAHPLLKLGLLLKCWTTARGGNSRSSNHTMIATDPAMWLAGLTYAVAQLPTSAVATTTSQQQQQQQQGPLLQVDFAHRRFLWDEGLRTSKLWLLDGLSMMHIWKTKDLLPRWLWNWLRQRQRLAGTTNAVDQEGQQQQPQKNKQCLLCHDKQEAGLDQSSVAVMVLPMQVPCCHQHYCYACLCLYARETPGRDFDCPACGSTITMEDAQRVA